MDQQKFIEIVWAHYDQRARHDLPWRHDTSEYAIVVSEVMLQQTQVNRVIDKFNSWVSKFPDWETLASAKLTEVLGEWQGLGYNRRGKFLHEAAKIVANDWAGKLKTQPSQLAELPGIGVNTAGAILAYSHNLPVVFIETNIRSVYIHHFFPDQKKVDDKQLLPLIKQTLDTDYPREWYWALMDYGSNLKRQIKNPSRRSRHYAKQSPFEGSLRQVRSTILKQVLEAGGEIEKHKLRVNDSRLDTALKGLSKDGLVKVSDKSITIV